MPKPVCVKCQRFYKPHKTGRWVLEGKPTNEAKPGLEDAHLWVPYKVWQADLYKCGGCQHEIVVGFGFNPVWQDYKGLLPQYEYIKVNDC
jgi:hypothetical protein